MKKIFPILMIFVINISTSFASVDCSSIEDCKLLIDNYKKELNILFNDLSKKDKDKLIVPSFEKSQILWNKYIKSDCEFMNSPMQMTLGEGYIIVYYECLASYYQNRILQVRKMISELE